VPAVESGSEKLPSAMSLDSSRHPLSQEEAHDGVFQSIVVNNVFFSFFFSLFSLEIQVDHLKFQDSPHSCVYLSVSSHSFDL
jgi:hypothetical protein